VDVQHQITGELRLVDGDLVLVGGNLQVATGSITANSIGAFNAIESSVQSISTTTWTETATAAACPAGDILVSCSVKPEPDPGATVTGFSWFPKVTGNSCKIRARAAGAAVSVKALANCFSPNG